MWEIDGSRKGWHVYGSKCIFVWLIIDQSEESWVLKVFKGVQEFIAFGFLIISETYILWWLGIIVLITFVITWIILNNKDYLISLIRTGL